MSEKVNVLGTHINSIYINFIWKIIKEDVYFIHLLWAENRAEGEY